MNSRRDVVLARVHFSDSTESKVRPAIIVSNKEYHKTNFFLLASITTSNDEYCIPISKNDVNCFLNENSHARFDGIQKLHSKLIIKRIGKVNPEFQEKLVEKIIATLKH